jgi:hypothetical protein
MRDGAARAVGVAVPVANCSGQEAVRRVHGGVRDRGAPTGEPNGNREFADYDLGYFDQATCRLEPSLPGVICPTGSVLEAAGEGPADQRVKIGIGQNGRLRHARGRLEALQGVTCIVAKDPVDTARPVA